MDTQSPVSAGVVMTDVLGVKRNGEKTFVVVDASMTEVIRPALYGAQHRVTQLTRPPVSFFSYYVVVYTFFPGKM